MYHYILILKSFFPKNFISSSSHFKDLNITVERLKKAHIDHETIAICGDYDADGMTSTALLLNALKEMNIDAIPAIPNRINEGYGLNIDMVNNLNRKGIKVIITVPTDTKELINIYLPKLYVLNNTNIY